MTNNNMETWKAVTWALLLLALLALVFSLLLGGR